MPFFKFNQNNSGGFFQIDDVLCETVFIEADNNEEACRFFLDWGGYFDGVAAGLDCGCCGDRWYEPYSAEEFPRDWDGRGTFLNSVEEYARKLLEGWGMRETIRIFYKNGDTLEIRKMGPDATVEELKKAA